MKNLVKSILIILLAAWIFPSSVLADREIRYVPGIGTYGENNSRSVCNRCGKVYMIGTGHTCVVERPDRGSSSSGGGYQASDAEGDAVIASDPSLQINNTYMKPWTPVEEYEPESGKSSLLKILLVIAFAGFLAVVAGGGVAAYIYWKRKNR